MTYSETHQKDVQQTQSGLPSAAHHNHADAAARAPPLSPVSGLTLANIVKEEPAEEVKPVRIKLEQRSDAVKHDSSSSPAGGGIKAIKREGDQNAAKPRKKRATAVSPEADPGPEDVGNDEVAIDAVNPIPAIPTRLLTVPPRHFSRIEDWGLPTISYTALSPPPAELDLPFVRQSAKARANGASYSDVGTHGGNTATSCRGDRDGLGNFFLSADPHDEGKRTINKVPSAPGAPFVMFNYLWYLDQKVVKPHTRWNVFFRKAPNENYFYGEYEVVRVEVITPEMMNALSDEEKEELYETLRKRAPGLNDQGLEQEMRAGADGFFSFAVMQCVGFNLVEFEKWVENRRVRRAAM
ncbi:hypothetical protein MNV49_001139 [Pseudohyphozyma bogoriensis]|nr:hypothetical protein MNV49_001139 [Pseudohyphozyma bogoriensis]